MGVLMPSTVQTVAEVVAANLATQAGKVREAVGRWSAPKPKADPDDAAPPPRPGPCSVLIVAATVDEADQLARTLRDCPAEFTTVATHGSLAGRGFDLVVYRPGWRGVKSGPTNPHPAADQWKTAIVLTRFRNPTGGKWELYL